MMTFSPLRLFFLVFGVVFLSLSGPFLLSPRLRKSGILNLFAAFLADFGSFFVLLGFWDIVGPHSLVAHVFSLVLGMPLAPIGLAVILRLFGGESQMRRWLPVSVGATVVCCLVCSALFIFGFHRSLALSVCYGYVFGSYAIALGIELYKLRPLSNLPRELSVFLFFLSLCILMLAAILVLQALSLDTAQYLVWVTESILFCFTAATIYRNPDTFLIVENQSKEVRSSRSLLNNVDIESKLESLASLMREEELYSDPDLRLEQVAGRLDLSPHQLSELLNGHVQQTFSEYVMRFRIERAQRELLEDERANILDIAFNCGFGAKSTFNEAFRKLTGQTPSAFREAKKPATAKKKSNA